MFVKTVEVRHDGGMRFVARTGSGHELVMDDRSGDTGPGPVEVLAAALAACTAMDVVSIAGKQRQRIDRYEIHVRAEQREAYPQVYTDIDLVHEVKGPKVDSSAVRRAIALSAEKYCPISAMLSAGDTRIHHRYRIVRPDTGTEDGEVMVTGPYRRPDVLD